MNVLFLALGANRRIAVAAESREVVERGGRAVVLAADVAAWPADELAPGVRVVALAPSGAGWLASAEQVIVYRGPRFVLRRLLGGSTPRAKRVVGAYERRIAAPIHRRVCGPVLDRLASGDRRWDAYWRRNGAQFDAVVVTDPLSFPAAARLSSRTGTAPAIGFRLADVTSA